jgi:hypothetical protein
LKSSFFFSFRDCKGLIIIFFSVQKFYSPKTKNIKKLTSIKFLHSKLFFKKKKVSLFSIIYLFIVDCLSTLNFKNKFIGKKGTITAANASKLNDGACAILLTNEETVKRLNLKPLAKIVAFCDVATDPIDFPIAPIYATEKVIFSFFFLMKNLNYEIIKLN